MHHATRILVVDHEGPERGRLGGALRNAGYETGVCATAAEAVRAQNRMVVAVTLLLPTMADVTSSTAPIWE